MAEDTIPLFLSFCIEQYKNAKGLSGHEAMEVLQKVGALDYLERNYEVLHTQGHKWLIEEIDEYIQNHKSV